MVKNLIFRQIRKSSFFSIVKFISFLIGFTTVIVVLEWVKKEYSYDDFWKNGTRLYRVGLEQFQNKELQFQMASNYRGVSDLMLREFPEVEGRVRLHRDRVTVFTPEVQIQDVDMFYADTCIFDILDRKILAVASSSLFPDLQSILISESLSHKLYGRENPIGKILKLNEGWKFYVSGVFEDVPENSHIRFDLLMTVPSLYYYMSHFNNLKGELDLNEIGKYKYNEPGPYDKESWIKWYGYSYILVKEGTRIEDLKKKAESLMAPEKLPSFNPNTNIKLIFQPITSIHLHSQLKEELKINGSQFKVYTLILVAFVVMLISMVNCINLSIIDFYDQVSNSAIRLIHGASTMRLFKFIFIKEFIISLSAGLCFLWSRLLYFEYYNAWNSTGTGFNDLNTDSGNNKCFADFSISILPDKISQYSGSVEKEDYHKCKRQDFKSNTCFISIWYFFISYCLNHCDILPTALHSEKRSGIYPGINNFFLLSHDHEPET